MRQGSSSTEMFTPRSNPAERSDELSLRANVEHERWVSLPQPITEFGGSDGGRSRRSRVVERGSAGWPQEGKHEQPAERKRLAVLREADLQAELSERRLVAVRAAQTVPPREREPEVRVRLGDATRVMDPVHVGRDDESPEPSVRALRHRYVAVVEQRGRAQENLERDDRPRRGADENDDRELQAGGDHDLERVEADAGADVETKIRVVHAVQAPERRDRVEHHVLQIDGEIERQDRHDPSTPRRQRKPMVEADRAVGGERRHGDQRADGEQTHQRGVRQHEPEVRGPADTPRLSELATRTRSLPRRHRGERGYEASESQSRFQHAPRSLPETLIRPISKSKSLC